MGFGESFLRGRFAVDPRQSPVSVFAVRPAEPRKVVQFAQQAGNSSQRSVS
jgi:hypothetical protein